MSLLANLAFHHRRAVLVLFALLTAAAVLYGRKTAHSLIAGGFDDPTSESSRADVLLEEGFGLGTPDVLAIYSHASLQVADADYTKLLAPALERMRAVQGVERVSTPYGPHADAIVSKDGHEVMVAVRLGGRGHSAQAAYDRVEPQLRIAGLQSRLGGAIPAARQAQVAAEDDLVRAELVTLPLVALLLVVFFRGVVVAALPLLVGGFSVAAALACIRLLTHVTDVSIFAMNIVTFVGLGVAIDYSLFMASRFRDELAAGSTVEHAIKGTLRTSGRTIAYSGAAVAVSLLALSVFPIMLLRSVALAGSLVVLMSLLGSLLFLPAMLSALGPRVELLSFGHQKPSNLSARFWQKVAASVMRAPLTVTLAVTALLVLLGLPFLHVKSSVAGASALPAHAEARLVAEEIEQGRFPAAATAPVLVHAQLPTATLSEASLKTLDRYVARLAALPHVTHIDAVVGGSQSMPLAQLLPALQSPAGETIRARLAPLAKERTTAIRLALDVDPVSEEAQRFIRSARAIKEPGLSVSLTSPAARLVDLRETLYEGLPWALGIIVLATFVVLFLAFGSIVMPIKAILMNVLSLTASFGALVFIFQEGRLEGLLNFRSPGSIELTVPVIMFAVVFGLAMDYELFLLSRIREVYDHTGDTHLSVTRGLEKTGQLITRAALLLVAVMVGFMSADMLLIKEMGVGMAVAVIVDATIVRALLVPATMQLLGGYNWWAPAPLAAWWKRMHLGVDESEPGEPEPNAPPVERISTLGA